MAARSADHDEGAVGDGWDFFDGAGHVELVARSGLSLALCGAWSSTRVVSALNLKDEPTWILPLGGSAEASVAAVAYIMWKDAGRPLTLELMETMRRHLDPIADDLTSVVQMQLLQPAPPTEVDAPPGNLEYMLDQLAAELVRVREPEFDGVAVTHVLTQRSDGTISRGVPQFHAHWLISRRLRLLERCIFDAAAIRPTIEWLARRPVETAGAGDRRSTVYRPSETVPPELHGVFAWYERYTPQVQYRAGAEGGASVLLRLHLPPGIGKEGIQHARERLARLRELSVLDELLVWAGGMFLGGHATLADNVLRSTLRWLLRTAAAPPERRRKPDPWLRDLDGVTRQRRPSARPVPRPPRLIDRLTQLAGDLHDVAAAANAVLLTCWAPGCGFRLAALGEGEDEVYLFEPDASTFRRISPSGARRDSSAAAFGRRRQVYALVRLLRSLEASRDPQQAIPEEPSLVAVLPVKPYPPPPAGDDGADADWSCIEVADHVVHFLAPGTDADLPFSSAAYLTIGPARRLWIQSSLAAHELEHCATAIARAALSGAAVPTTATSHRHLVSAWRWTPHELEPIATAALDALRVASHEARVAVSACWGKALERGQFEWPERPLAVSLKLVRREGKLEPSFVHLHGAVCHGRDREAYAIGGTRREWGEEFLANLPSIDLKPLDTAAFLKVAAPYVRLVAELVAGYDRSTPERAFGELSLFPYGPAYGPQNLTRTLYIEPARELGGGVGGVLAVFAASDSDSDRLQRARLHLLVDQFQRNSVPSLGRTPLPERPQSAVLLVLHTSGQLSWFGRPLDLKSSARGVLGALVRRLWTHPSEPYVRASALHKGQEHTLQNILGAIRSALHSALSPVERGRLSVLLKLGIEPTNRQFSERLICLEERERDSKSYCLGLPRSAILVEERER